MAETEKLPTVPSVPCLGAGQVGQQAPKPDHPRHSSGTVDLKALAFKVLRKANAGQAWDKGGTEVSQTPVPQNRPVGQLQGLSGKTWAAEDWAAFFDERAGFLQFDCGVPRQDAERRALDELQGHWRALHPLNPGSPEAGCTQCGTLGGIDLVPVLAGNSDHAWVHFTCWSALDMARRAEALAALRKLIPPLPENAA